MVGILAGTVKDSLIVLINSSRVATKPDRDALRFIGQIVDTLPLPPTCPHCAAIKFYSEADNFCCMEGRIVITDNELPDNHLKQLLSLTPEDPESFRTYIRTYSNLFVFTSMGVKADNSFTRRNKEVYTFRVQGRYNNKECLSTSIGYEKDNKMAWLNELVTLRGLLMKLMSKMLRTVKGVAFDAKVAEIKALIDNEVYESGETVLFTAAERRYIQLEKVTKWGGVGGYVVVVLGGVVAAGCGCVKGGGGEMTMVLVMWWWFRLGCDDEVVFVDGCNSRDGGGCGVGRQRRW
ncbi:hypothetical protein Tco_1155902 [Tanacetum coccineum]